MTFRTLWEAYDTRTGRSVAMAKYLTEEQVRQAIKGWVARDKAGGRPDLHSTIPYIDARPVPSDLQPEGPDIAYIGVPASLLKGLRESLCVAQTDLRDDTHLDNLQKLISRIDVHRPLASDGTHKYHTATCGCQLGGS